MDNCSIVDFNHIANVRAGISLVVALFTVIFIVAAICRLLYQQYTFVYPQTKKCCTLYFVHTIVCNPFLWLALSSMLASFSFSNFLAIHDKASCESAGYATQALESFENWMTLFFGIYFIVYVAVNGKPLTDDHADEGDVSSGCCYICHGTTVLLIVLILFILSFLYNMPSAIEGAGGSYGNSGPWCWIEGMAAQVGFWYVLYWIVQGIVVICLIIAILILVVCKRKEWNIKKTLVLASVLLLYYIIHNVFGIIESVVRLDNRNDCSERIRDLWIAYAVLTPFSKLFLVGAALLFLTLQPLSSKKYMQFTT